MLCERLLLLIPALVGLIFTIFEKGIPRWEFANWNSLTKEAANPIVETWGSEQRFDLIVLDDHLHLPSSVTWAPPDLLSELDPHIEYFSWILNKVITAFFQLRSIVNNTVAIATIVMILVILVACLGATIHRLCLKKQAEKCYLTSLVQFMNKEAVNCAWELKSVSDHLRWFISTQEAQIFESIVELMFEQENSRRMKTELILKGERIRDLNSELDDIGIEKTKVEDKSTRQATAIQQLNTKLAEVKTQKNTAEERSQVLESDMATAAAKAETRIRFLKADAKHLLELIASQWSQMGEARVEIDATNEKIAELELKLSNRTEEISIINVSLDNASYRIEEVEKFATDLQSKVARRDNTILRLKSEATSSEKNSKLLQAAKEESEARALEQKSKLKDENLRAILAKEDRESELVKVRKENATAASQISRGQKEIHKLKREMEELSKKLVIRDELASQTYKEKAAIEASLVEALERVAEERANIRRRDEKYSVLESEMKEAKRDFQKSLAEEKNRLQLEHQQLESEMLDKHNAKMASIKGKYDGVVEDTKARVKALEEENTRLGDERDVQIVAINAEHGDFVQKVTAIFAGELTAVEDQNRRLMREKKAAVEELASTTTALEKEKAKNEAKPPREDKKTARIIGDLQASLATAGREAQEWRTEAYIAIVRRMPPTRRGLSLYNMDSRNFPGSDQMSAPPLESSPSFHTSPSGHLTAVSSFTLPNPPSSLPPCFPFGPSGHLNIVSSVPAGASSGHSNTDSGLPPHPQAFAGLNPAASEFRAANDAEAT